MDAPGGTGFNMQLLICSYELDTENGEDTHRVSSGLQQSQLPRSERETSTEDGEKAERDPNPDPNLNLCEGVLLHGLIFIFAPRSGERTSYTLIYPLDFIDIY